MLLPPLWTARKWVSAIQPQILHSMQLVREGAEVDLGALLISTLAHPCLGGLAQPSAYLFALAADPLHWSQYSGGSMWSDSDTHWLLQHRCIYMVQRWRCRLRVCVQWSRPLVCSAVQTPIKVDCADIVFGISRECQVCSTEELCCFCVWCIASHSVEHQWPHSDRAKSGNPKSLNDARHKQFQNTSVYWGKHILYSDGLVPVVLPKTIPHSKVCENIYISMD